ncbi:hypothetical protein MMC30_009061 [Trapelia coarctata]|nr:hypothetical protein [Trapelia coarctata]
MLQRAPPSSDGDSSRGLELLIPAGITVSAALILVSLRVYVRVKVVHKLGNDDLLIVVGMIFDILTMACLGLGVANGVGRHLSYLSTGQAEAVAKWLLFGEVFWMATGTFTRISVAVFLLRIFKIMKLWRWGLYALISVTLVSGIFGLVIRLARCQPFALNWDRTIPGTCWPIMVLHVYGYLNGGLSIFCDGTLASLPVVILWRIQMSCRTKIAVCSLMGMGWFAAGCAVGRTVYFFRIESAEDFSYDLFHLGLWAALELNIGICAACIPTLRPLFRTASSAADVYHRQLKPGSHKPTDNWHALQRVQAFRPSTSTDRITDSSVEDHNGARKQTGGIKATTDMHVLILDQKRANLVEHKHEASIFPEHFAADQV